MKNRIKKIIDIAMTCIFIILMGYYATENKIHEILGTITFILFIIHHILNIKWYKSIFKGFVLMAIHVGLHITALMNKLNTKMKNSTFEYVYYFILAILVGLGIYSFINLKVWEDMFLVNDFKFFDYEQSPIIFYLKYILVLVTISLVIYFVFSLIRKLNNKKKEKGGK